MLLAILGLLASAGGEALPPVVLTHGPFVGHVGSDEAFLWVRASRAATLDFRVLPEDGRLPARSATVVALPDHDGCCVGHLPGLAPATSYRYEIHGDGHRLAGGADHVFRTAPPPVARTRARLAFGSCADDRRFPSQPVWTRILESGAQGIVLLGDTPYIDSVALAAQRRRYRELYSVPELVPVLRRLPLWATWDDHDFGRGDALGTLPGKEGSRQAFLEYHALRSYGAGNQGIYTSFRFGPLEVFLLDTRWFARTARSFADPERATLLGATQWEWLRRGLLASRAPFKILACGMVWNDAVRLLKLDHWGSFPQERNELFRFIGKNGISGVVLVGGDIHRSRVLRHPTRELAGYELTELITSPLANWALQIADRPTPLLLHDAGEPETFLLVDADGTSDPPVLVARFLTAGGRELFEVRLTLEELRAREGAGSGR